jgi:hypothetical protein
MMQSLKWAILLGHWKDCLCSLAYSMTTAPPNSNIKEHVSYTRLFLDSLHGNRPTILFDILKRMYWLILLILLQIIHMKRFQFLNGRWVKSQKIVNFPRSNFDPTHYLAKRSWYSYNCSSSSLDEESIHNGPTNHDRSSMNSDHSESSGKSHLIQLFGKMQGSPTGSGNLEKVEKIKFACQGLEKVETLCVRKLRSWKGGEIYQGDEKCTVVNKVFAAPVNVSQQFYMEMRRSRDGRFIYASLQVFLSNAGGLQWGSSVLVGPGWKVLICHFGLWNGYWKSLEIFWPQSVGTLKMVFPNPARLCEPCA